MFLWFAVIIIIFFMLAILSRKNFSKYKNVKYGKIMFLWLAIADFLYLRILKVYSFENLKKRLRKTNVVSNKKLEIMVKQYVVNVISCCLLVTTIFCLIGIANTLNKNDEVNKTNVIMRNDYQGNTLTQNLFLQYKDKVYEYEMEIEPVEYSKDEFEEKVDKLYFNLTTEILGKNSDTNHIYYDLEIPYSSDDGVFEYEWESSRPDVLSAYGKVYNEEINSNEEVILKVHISYLHYDKEEEFKLLVCPIKNLYDEQIQVVKETLTRLEYENRLDREVILPNEINGVKIKTDKDTSDKTSVRVFVIGVLCCVIIVIISNNSLNNNLAERNRLMKEEYPRLVNKIWLMLGTGMTIKMVFYKIANEGKKNNLINEIEYTVNQINSGYDEIRAYEELGNRIGFPEYVRLMNRINQNIKKGTKDLRKLMEEEVIYSLTERKEKTKKRGEEASTKMLFPMIVLLFIVMIIVMFPAMVSF